MVKSTENRKFELNRSQQLSHTRFGVAPNRDTPTELLDDHRALEPPDPIPNSAVKRRFADGSVGFPHVRVGHRQAPKTRTPIRERGLGFCLFSLRKARRARRRTGWVFPAPSRLRTTPGRSSVPRAGGRSPASAAPRPAATAVRGASQGRSEERRVGKEYRSQRALDPWRLDGSLLL